MSDEPQSTAPDTTADSSTALPVEITTESSPGTSTSTDPTESVSDNVASGSTDVSASDVRVEVSDLGLPPTAMDWEEVSSEASDAINNVVCNIVEKMRVERMFELRRLQHGDRAVSSGQRREQLEELFSQDQPEVGRRAHRSEGVRDELEQLARNASVGNLLNTRFRTLLENSLSTPRVPTYTRQAPRAARPAAPPPPPPGFESTGDRLAREAAELQRTAPPQQPLPDPQYEPPDFSDRQFDYAITDVEELFQRRLVSDVLHSAFRNVLELHIERRLVRSGIQPNARAPGQEPRFRTTHPQQQPQSQPQPQQQQQQQRYPDIAAPSSSRRLPEMERKLHVMSIEMKEMKNMLKLLVDTQVDIQRSIRQEVNALIRNSNVEPARPTKQIKEGSCVVCLEVPCDTVIYRCGHFCCCYSCARQLRVEGHHCPVCRAEVTDILRIYKSTYD